MRAMLLTLLIVSFSFASWCVIHSTQKRVHGKEDVEFFQKYPFGFLSKDGKWIRFVSGPYPTKEEAKKIVSQTRRRYPTAYIIRCNKLYLENIRKSFTF